MGLEENIPETIPVEGLVPVNQGLETGLKSDATLPIAEDEERGREFLDSIDPNKIPYQQVGGTGGVADTETLDKMFDARKFLGHFPLTPEDELNQAASSQGIDYVTAREYPKETLEQYERDEYDRFQARDDVSEDMKKLFEDPEMNSVQRSVRDSVSYADKVLKADISDFGVLAGSGALSVYEQAVVTSLVEDPENPLLQNLLADISKKRREFRKADVSDRYKEYEETLHKGGMASDVLTVLTSPIQTSKTLVEMGAMFTPTIAATGAGTVTGGPFLGFLAGAVTMGYQERALWVEEWFDRRGYDISRRDHVARIFNDPEDREALISEMNRRGVTMAGMQLAASSIIAKYSPKLAKKISKYLGSGKKSKLITKKLVDLAGETTSEVTSEAAGRVAAIGVKNWTDQDWEEVWMEGLYGFMPAAARSFIAHDYVTIEEEKKAKAETGGEGGKIPDAKLKPRDVPEGGKPQMTVEEALSDSKGVLKEGIPLTQKEQETLDQITEKQAEINDILDKKLGEEGKKLQGKIREMEKDSPTSKKRILEQIEKIKKALNNPDTLASLEETKQQAEKLDDQDLKELLKKELAELEEAYNLPPSLLRTEEEIRKVVPDTKGHSLVMAEDIHDLAVELNDHAGYFGTKHYLDIFFDKEGANLSQSQKDKISKNFLSRFDTVDESSFDLEDRIHILMEELEDKNRRFLEQRLDDLLTKKDKTPEDKIRLKIYGNFYHSKNKTSLSHHDVELAVRLIKGASRVMGVDMNYLADRYIVAFNNEGRAYYNPASGLIQLDPEIVSEGDHRSKLLIFHETGHFIMAQIYKHYQSNPNEKSKKFLEAMYKAFNDVTAMADPRKGAVEKRTFNEFMEYSQGALDRYAGMMQPVESVMKERIKYLEKIYERHAREKGTDQYGIDFTGVFNAEIKSIFFDLLVLNENIETNSLTATEALERMGLETWYLNHILTTKGFLFYNLKIPVSAFFGGVDPRYFVDAIHPLPQLPLPQLGISGEKIGEPTYDYLMTTRKSIFEILSNNMSLPIYIINYKNLVNDIKDIALAFPVFDVEFELSFDEAEAKKAFDKAQELKRRLKLFPSKNIPSKLRDKAGKNRQEIIKIQNKYTLKLMHIATRLNDWRMRKYSDLINKADSRVFNAYQNLLMDIVNAWAGWGGKTYRVLEKAEQFKAEGKITEKQLAKIKHLSVFELDAYKSFNNLLKTLVNTMTEEQLNYFLNQGSNPDLNQRILNAEILGFEPKGKDNVVLSFAEGKLIQEILKIEAERDIIKKEYDEVKSFLKRLAEKGKIPLSSEYLKERILTLNNILMEALDILNGRMYLEAKRGVQSIETRRTLNRVIELEKEISELTKALKLEIEFSLYKEYEFLQKKLSELWDKRRESFDKVNAISEKIDKLKAEREASPDRPSTEGKELVPKDEKTPPDRPSTEGKELVPKVFKGEVVPSSEAQAENRQRERLSKEYKGFVKQRYTNLIAELLRNVNTWFQLPQLLLERMGEYNPKSEHMKLFNTLQKAYVDADEAWQKQYTKMRNLLGKRYKKLFNDTKAVSRDYKSRKTGYTVRGLRDLVHLLLNMGNSKNINNTLNSSVNMDGKLIPLREVIKEGLKNEILSKDVTERRKAVAKYRFDKSNVYDQFIRYLDLMRKDSKGGNIYLNPEFPVLLQSLLDFYEKNREAIESQGGLRGKEIHGSQVVEWALDAETLNKTIDGLLAGYFLNDIITDANNSIPSDVFKFVEDIWGEFKTLHGPLAKAREKVGRPMGEVKPDLGKILLPWFNTGGYFPIRETRTEGGESGWIPKVKSWSDESFTKKRKGTDRGDVLPTNVNLEAELLGIMRAMTRSASLIEAYEYVVSFIGPDSFMWNKYKAFSPEVIPVLKGWLQRVQAGTMSYDKSVYVRSLQKLTNRVKAGSMFWNPIVSIEQLTGVIIPSGHEIPAKIVKEIVVETLLDLRGSHKWMIENSKVMRSNTTNKQFDLYLTGLDRFGRHVFPVLDPSNPMRNLKKALRGVNLVGESTTQLGYLPLKIAQVGFVNTIYFMVHYKAAMSGHIKGLNFTHEEAIDFASNAVTGTQFMLSPEMTSAASANPVYKVVRIFNSFFIGLRGRMLNLVHKRLKYDGDSQKILNRIGRLMPLIAIFALTGVPRALINRLLQEDDPDKEDEGFAYWLLYFSTELFLESMDVTGVGRTALGHYAHPEYAGRYFMTNQNLPALSAVYGGVQIPTDVLKGLQDEDKDFGINKKSAAFLGLFFPPIPAINKWYSYYMRKEMKDPFKSAANIHFNTTPSERSYLNQKLLKGKTDPYEFFFGKEGLEELMGDK